MTIIHGGQTGIDRGAHEAAIDNGWSVTGYMPRDGRDERGPIPPDIARFLVRHNKTSYAARTEANVRTSTAVLIVVRDANDPRATPGTAKTIDLAIERRLRRRVVDPSADAVVLAHWIWSSLHTASTLPLPLPFETRVPDTIPMRLLVAGPRESLWQSARVEVAALLRRVGLALAEIAQRVNPRHPPSTTRFPR